MRVRLILLMASMLCSGILHAQSTERIDSVDVRIYYKQGYSIIDLNYKDNKNRIGLFADKIADLRRDTLSRIISVSVEGSASPEGPKPLNKKLSLKRATSAVNIVSGFLPYNIETKSKGADWHELATAIEGSNYLYKDEILDILKNVPEWIVRNGVVVDGKQRRLKRLKDGKAWKHMLDNEFPELRNATIHVVYAVKPQPLPAPAPKPEEPVVVPQDTTLTNNNIPAEEPADVNRGFSFALRTNALYDAALVPNIGVEFFLNNGWTIGGNWMYGWWDTNKRHRYWRIYGGDIEVRKYLKRNTSDIPYNGHYLGLYAQMLTYDFELGGKGYMGGEPGGTLWDRINYVVAAEYGYSLPVARRLNIDFGIGVGFMGGRYYEYEPIDGHYVWQATKQRKWFGPTKAEISLKWLIGRGNYNGRKK